MMKESLILAVGACLAIFSFGSPVSPVSPASSQGQCTGSVCASSYGTTEKPYWTVVGLGPKNGKGLGPTPGQNECAPCKKCSSKVQWWFSPPLNDPNLGYSIAMGFGGFTSGTGAANGIFTAKPANCASAGATDTFTTAGAPGFTGRINCSCSIWQVAVGQSPSPRPFLKAKIPSRRAYLFGPSF